MITKTENTQRIRLDFDYKDTHYTGYAEPFNSSCREGVCYEMEIYLNGKAMGMLYRWHEQWFLEGQTDQEFIDVLGGLIQLWYE